MAELALNSQNHEVPRVVDDGQRRRVCPSGDHLPVRGTGLSSTTASAPGASRRLENRDMQDTVGRHQRLQRSSWASLLRERRCPRPVAPRRARRRTTRSGGAADPPANLVVRPAEIAALFAGIGRLVNTRPGGELRAGYLAFARCCTSCRWRSRGQVTGVWAEQTTGTFEMLLRAPRADLAARLSASWSRWPGRPGWAS